MENSAASTKYFDVRVTFMTVKANVFPMYFEQLLVGPVLFTASPNIMVLACITSTTRLISITFTFLLACY